MKKLTTLLLAAGLVFAASAPASAVDVKVDGQYVFDYQVGETVVNKHDVERRIAGTAKANNFDGAGQRLRLGLTLAASENLSGYVQFQKDENWGVLAGKHGDNNITFRQGYIDWIIPQTNVKVRMGRQQLGLPTDAIGNWNAIMDTAWAGRDAIAVSAPVADFMNVTAFWYRAGAASAKEDVSAPNADAFGAVVNLKFDGLTISPYVMYANIDAFTFGEDLANGANVSGTAWTNDYDEYQDTSDANAYWVGFSSTLSYFDPFTLKLSAAYGAKAYDNYNPLLAWGLAEGHDGHQTIKDRRGWYAQAKASYKTAYGTPVLGAWYASGDDANEYARQGWIPTLGGRFGATHVFNGATVAATASYPDSRYNIGGTWGIQAGIENVSFLEDLSHTFLVTLYKGTNNSDNYAAKIVNAWEYLTTKDTLVEFDLLSTYKIYKNLSATLELGYIIADIDNGAHSVPGVPAEYRADYSSNAWRTGLTFQYTF